MNWLVVAVAAAVAVLIAGEWKQNLRITAPAKMAASLGFLALAISNAEPLLWHGLMLAGFALSVTGDALLLATQDKRLFLLGLGSFLAAHALFASAFIVAGLNPTWLIVALAPLAGAVLAVERWLRPHAPRAMRWPVLAYMVAIGAMVAAAFATWPVRQNPWLPLGAVLFAASDLTVARQRFVTPGFENRAVGLPLYYAGQLMLASSLA